MRVVRGAELVQDAPGFLFRARIVLDTLQARQVQQCGARDGWKVVEQVHSHADRVSTEQTVEQTVCPGRGQQRPVGAQFGEALNAAELAQDGDEGVEADAVHFDGG